MCLGAQFHGSTALETVLLSSPRLATLCSARTWQCEGDHVLYQATGDDVWRDWENQLRDGWNYSRALELWSEVWDLRRPVLLEKTPNQFLTAETLVTELSSSPLPESMVRMSIRALDLRLVIMWRPWCLSVLSSHARDEMAYDYYVWAHNEFIKRNARHAHHHRFLTTLGTPAWSSDFGAASPNARLVSSRLYPTLVVSFADLLWRPQYTLQRLESFMPELGTLNAGYVPRLNIDYFPENRLKVHGTVQAYGEAHPPPTLGYDPEARECIANSSHWPNVIKDPLTVLTQVDQQIARDALAHLKQFS